MLELGELERLAQLEGLISEEVGLALASLAAVVQPPAVIVEIGSYRGKSTAYLASGAANGFGALVVAIDPWDSPGNAGGRFGFDRASTRAAFDLQLKSAGLRDRVEAQQAFSVEAAKHWRRPIGLLYIDGSHLEKDVRADWEAWCPHLTERSIVVFDDYQTKRNPGVTRVVDEVRKGDTAFRWGFEPKPLAIRLPR